MTSKERVEAVLNFRKSDRLPVIEWAPYWDKTVERWHDEGLDAALVNPWDIREHFGLDLMEHLWVRPRTKHCPSAAYGKPVISNERDYDDIRKYLFPVPALSPEELERAAQLQFERGAAIYYWIEGLFWQPRELLGIEGHMLSFYDEPDLMKRMISDSADFIINATNDICRYLSPQFAVIGEDMSYNHGPMFSNDIFEEFFSASYKKISSYIKSKDIKVFVDSDGLVDKPVDWYLGTGFEGILPLEKQAGVDIVSYRKKHPELLLVGAFDKMSMSRGEAAMANEFERLLPVMRQGGYIPGVDHQTPPEVSLEDYKLYLKLLNEYCRSAVL
jgi:hypothetical protein